jgi:hypothetical protein
MPGGLSAKKERVLVVIMQKEQPPAYINQEVQNEQ